MVSTNTIAKIAVLALSALLLGSCASHIPGPDKQGEGVLVGAAMGAGSGAVTGFQFGAASGPGAAIGAGVGAVAGGVKGFMQDYVEEGQLRIKRGSEKEQEIAFAQRILAEQYRRRVDLHPTREIYPADIFFTPGTSKLSGSGKIILSEIAALNSNRLSWSRLAIASYVKSSDDDSYFAKSLSEERAKRIGDLFTRQGIEPRRLVAYGIITKEPVLVDAYDDPFRYSEAVELIPLDR